MDENAINRQAIAADTPTAELKRQLADNAEYLKRNPGDVDAVEAQDAIQAELDARKDPDSGADEPQEIAQRTDSYAHNIAIGQNPITAAVNKAARTANWVVFVASDLHPNYITDFTGAMESAAHYCQSKDYLAAKGGFLEAARIIAGNDDMTNDTIVAMAESVSGECGMPAQDRATIASMFCVAAAGIIANKIGGVDNE